MKRRIFGWISALVGIALSLAAIEATAIVWLMIEDGHYTPADELFERTQNTYVRDMTKGTDCRYVDTLFPHPYVAFVHHANPPCGKPWVNNVGLFGPDYPTVKPADRYVVLVTGGSVAGQLVQELKPPLPKYLEEELNKRYVSPNGKPFLVLNGGDGAWKEPQQFILFSLYVTSIDAVVTLDGYNEHFLFFPGTFERLERPLSNFAEVNPFVADENFGDAAIGWVIGRIAGRLSQLPVLGHSHAAYMIIRGIEGVAKSKDIFESNKKTTLSSIFRMPEEIRNDHERAFQLQLGLYQKYMRSIEVLAHEYNVRTAHFLQPVPAWGKTLTEEEKKAVGDLSYGPLYRRIVDGMMKLRDQGMPIYDLGNIFQNETGRIYFDQIHCVREGLDAASPGYRIMAARVGEKLAEAWKLKEKSAN
jgi:hypothetical protein